MSLGSQRHLFEIPREVAYLDGAAYSPLPRAVREAGEAGIASKSRPWDRPRDLNDAWAARCRVAAAALIGASAEDIAITGSVSYGVATAALNLALPRGGRILRVAGEFPSLCHAFDRLASRDGLVVEEVPAPADGDWTSALLAAIERPGAAPMALATLTPLHWCDGAPIDLDRVIPAARAAGAAVVVDATQAVGVLPVDVTRWRPDFLAFPTYKWLLGPYGTAFLYAAPDRQGGQPLEEHAFNRTAAGAARYDRGEFKDPAALPMAATGMELVLSWGVAAVAARLRALTDGLAARLSAAGFEVPARRAPHILGLRLAGGMPPDLTARLAAEGCHASNRGGVLRISPHVWADEADIARFAEVLRRLA